MYTLINTTNNIHTALVVFSCQCPCNKHTHVLFQSVFHEKYARIHGISENGINKSSNTRGVFSCPLSNWIPTINRISPVVTANWLFSFETLFNDIFNVKVTWKSLENCQVFYVESCKIIGKTYWIVPWNIIKCSL